MTKTKDKTCWICKRTKKELEAIKGVIEDDLNYFCEIYPEDVVKDYKFITFKKNKFHVCDVCLALLNGFIDNRHPVCDHDDQFKDVYFKLERWEDDTSHKRTMPF